MHDLIKLSAEVPGVCRSLYSDLRATRPGKVPVKLSLEVPGVSLGLNLDCRAALLKVRV